MKKRKKGKLEIRPIFVTKLEDNPEPPPRNSSLQPSAAAGKAVTEDDDYSIPLELNVPHPPARTSSLMKKYNRKNREIFETVKDRVENFEMKKFGKWANMTFSKFPNSRIHNWLGFSKKNQTHELDYQGRPSANER